MEEEIQKQLDAFEKFGINKTSYKECVDELIRLYTELMNEKVKREKNDMFQRLLEINNLRN